MFPILMDLGELQLWGLTLPLRIGGYGTFLLLALTLGWAIGVRAGRRIDPHVPWGDILAAMLLTGVVVARLWAVFEHLPALSDGSLPWSAALASGGHWMPGAIAGFAVGALWLARSGVRLGETYNALALAISPAHATARFGCLLAGCCHGKPTDLPWGITYSDPHAAALAGTPLGTALHPSPLYEVGCEALNFALLVVLSRRNPRPGQLLATWAVLYGVERFFLELLRGGETSHLGPLTINQGVALLLFAAGAFFLGRPHLRRAPALSTAGLLVLLALPAAAEPLDLPRSYWVQGLGRMTVSGPACCEGYSFEGNFEARFATSSGGTIEVGSLNIQLYPMTIEHVGALGLGRLDLFCAAAQSQSPAVGSVLGGAIRLPPRAIKLGVVSYKRQLEDGTCEDLNLGLEVENSDTVSGLHDPSGNRFSLHGTFYTVDGGDTYTVTFVLEGVYVNRPPHALLGMLLPGFEQGGCPATWITGNPPRTVIEANDPAGLVVPLRSCSFDDDLPLSPWADLASELWYYQKDSTPFTLWGAGRDLGTQVFPYGVHHRLRLLAGDYQGAIAIDECAFEVVDTTAPVVEAPKAAGVPCSLLWGATPETSAELSEWLSSATAMDRVDATPTALPPLMWGAEITPSTFFTLARWAGPIPVEFRFRDASGNAASAWSTVTIQDGPACPDK